MERDTSFSSITIKTAIVHTATYFIMGAIAFILLNYSAKYADPDIAHFMRQTSDPLVAAGLLFQPLRGFLFGIVFYALRDVVFPHKHGWLTLWLMLVIVGILSPFSSAPGSIEGIVYTVLPLWFHFIGFPEVFIQSGLLAFITHYWVNHPEKKWIGWIFGGLLVIVLFMSLMAVLSAFGVLPRPAG